MDDEEEFRREIRRQVEVFLVDFKPLIMSYIKRFSQAPVAIWNDLYQDIVCYLLSKVPRDYKYDNLKGLFTYCKQLTCWYICKSRQEFYKRYRLRKTMLLDDGALEDILADHLLSNELKESIDLFDLVDHLEYYIKTDRERDVLRLLVEQFKRQDIAKELGISRQRVENILVKLQKYLKRVNDV